MSNGIRSSTFECEGPADDDVDDFGLFGADDVDSIGSSAADDVDDIGFLL